MPDPIKRHTGLSDGIDQIQLDGRLTTGQPLRESDFFHLHINTECLHNERWRTR